MRVTKLTEVSIKDIADGAKFRFEPSVFGRRWTKEGDGARLGDIWVRVSPDYGVYIEKEDNYQKSPWARRETAWRD